MATRMNDESSFETDDNNTSRRWLLAASVAARRNKGEKTRVPLTNEIAYVGGHIYLGTAAHAMDMNALAAFHITHVLNCGASHCGLSKNVVGKNVKYHKIGDDAEEASEVDGAAVDLLSGGGGATEGDVEMAARSDPSFGTGTAGLVKVGKDETGPGGGVGWLREVFPDARGFLDKAKAEGGRVLLCCLSGINRSPTIAVAYLIYSKRMELLPAIKKVRDVRGAILQVEGSIVQLYEMAKQQNLLGVEPWTNATASSVGGSRSTSVAQGQPGVVAPIFSVADGFLDGVDSDLASSYPSDFEDFNDHLLHDDAALSDDAMRRAVYDSSSASATAGSSDEGISILDGSRTPPQRPTRARGAGKQSRLPVAATAKDNVTPEEAAPAAPRARKTGQRRTAGGRKIVKSGETEQQKKGIGGNSDVAGGDGARTAPSSVKKGKKERAGVLPPPREQEIHAADLLV